MPGPPVRTNAGEYGFRWRRSEAYRPEVSPASVRAISGRRGSARSARATLRQARYSSGGPMDARPGYHHGIVGGAPSRSVAAGRRGDWLVAGCVCQGRDRPDPARNHHRSGRPGIHGPAVTQRCGVTPHGFAGATSKRRVWPQFRWAPHAAGKRSTEGREPTELALRLNSKPNGEFNSAPLSCCYLQVVALVLHGRLPEQRASSYCDGAGQENCNGYDGASSVTNPVRLHHHVPYHLSILHDRTGRLADRTRNASS